MFYLPKLRGPTIPTPKIHMTNQTYQEYIANHIYHIVIPPLDLNSPNKPLPYYVALCGCSNPPPAGEHFISVKNHVIGHLLIQNYKVCPECEQHPSLPLLLLSVL
jgi:hypothetical protein